MLLQLVKLFRLKGVPKFVIFKILGHRQFFADFVIKNDKKEIIRFLSEKKKLRSNIIYNKYPFVGKEVVTEKNTALAFIHGNVNYPYPEIITFSAKYKKIKIRFWSEKIADIFSKIRYTESYYLFNFLFQVTKYNDMKIPAFLIKKLINLSETILNSFLNFYSMQYSEEELHEIFNNGCYLAGFLNLCKKYPSLEKKYKQRNSDCLIY